jgi:hypothetical protein
MSEKRATTYAVLHLRFKLRVPPDVLLAHSREAATIITSVEGLIWKIWVLQQEELEMGGMYLFANRETAEAYLNHPVTHAGRGGSRLDKIVRTSLPSEGRKTCLSQESSRRKDS